MSNFGTPTKSSLKGVQQLPHLLGSTERANRDPFLLVFHNLSFGKPPCILIHHPSTPPSPPHRSPAAQSLAASCWHPLAAAPSAVAGDPRSRPAAWAERRAERRSRPSGLSGAARIGAADRRSPGGEDLGGGWKVESTCSSEKVWQTWQTWQTWPPVKQVRTM